MLDFRLRTFLILCKELNYTKTANLLHITQPAVSQHIKYLEQEYGVDLFYYEGRHLTLTNAGKILYDFALGIENSIDRTKQLMNMPSDTYPPLVFGTTRTIGEYTIPKILSELILDYPTMKLSMIVDNTNILLNKLENGEIDFALIEGQFDKGEYNSFTLSTEAFIGVCSPQNPIAKDSVNFKDIFNQRLIIREKGSGTREILEQILLEHNITMQGFDNIIEIGNIKAIKELVLKNLGITFLYKEAVKRELENGELYKIRISDFDVVREFNFVFLKNNLHYEEYIKWYKYFKSKIRSSTF